MKIKLLYRCDNFGGVDHFGNITYQRLAEKIKNILFYLDEYGTYIVKIEIKAERNESYIDLYSRA